MEKYKNAAAGLNTMFVAEIGAIICSVVMLIPVVGTIVGGIGNLVFSVLLLVGLNCAGKDIAGCKTAFTLSIVNIVLSLLAVILSRIAALNSLISIASSVISFLIIYYVCSSVAEALCEVGEKEIAESGEKVYKINFFCYVASIVIGILAWIPFLAAIAGILAMVVGVALIVAGVLYLVFLYKSSKALA